MEEERKNEMEMGKEAKKEDAQNAEEKSRRTVSVSYGKELYKKHWTEAQIRLLFESFLQRAGEVFQEDKDAQVLLPDKGEAAVFCKEEEIISFYFSIAGIL